MSNRTVILAIDSGGTKCEMLAVDAATGDIIREVRHQAGSLPAACRPKENFGDTRDRNVFAISVHSSSFDEVCFIMVEAKA